MAFEDLFGGGQDTSGSDFIGAQPGDDFQDPGGFDFEGLFSDPNFIRTLGETGAAISGPGSIGEAVGTGASNLVRRRQLQKGARGSRNKQESFQERLLEMLGKGNLLSAKDQNDAFDSMNLDGDGNVTLSMKNTPQKQGFQRQLPLESVRRPSAGGTDLPDFSNQPGGEAFDFAGLDSEDIGMLLKAEQQFGQLSQNEMKILLDEKARRQEIVTASRIRKEDLAQLAKDRTATITAKALEVREKKNIAKTLAESKSALEDRKSTLKVNADKLSPAELKVEELELRKLTKEVENLESGTGTTALEQANINRINSDIANKETELGIKLDTLEKDELLSVAPSFVDNKGVEVEVPFEEREANANQANNRPNSKVFYSISQPVEDAPGVYNWGTDVPGEVTPVFLPKHPTTGKQITTSDVMDTAAANKISPEEVLRQWGLIK